MSQGREFVLADIPGLIEGAHEGAGLGDRFLGHVERCRVLLHLVDATCEHAGKAYKTVRTELEAYEGHLADKIEIVALNKIDAVTPDELKKQKDRLKRAAKKTPLVLSAATGEGVQGSAAGAGRGDRRSPGVRTRPRAAAEAEPWARADAAEADLSNAARERSLTCACNFRLQNSITHRIEGGNHDRLRHCRHQRSQEGRRVLRQDLRRTGHGTLHGSDDRIIAWGGPGSGAGFGVALPYDGKPMTVGNGVMAAFGAKDKAQVDRVYKLALSLGGTCEGPPGQRSEQFYAAYFRDPEGNKLNAFVMG